MQGQNPYEQQVPYGQPMPTNPPIGYSPQINHLPTDNYAPVNPVATPPNNDFYQQSRDAQAQEMLDTVIENSKALNDKVDYGVEIKYKLRKWQVAVFIVMCVFSLAAYILIIFTIVNNNALKRQVIGLENTIQSLQEELKESEEKLRK